MQEEQTIKRVAITTNLQGRLDYWKNKYPQLKNWDVVTSKLTYDEAHHIEEDFVKKGYEGHPGGRRVKGNVYYVYTFEYEG